MRLAIMLMIQMMIKRSDCETGKYKGTAEETPFTATYRPAMHGSFKLY